MNTETPLAGVIGPSSYARATQDRQTNMAINLCQVRCLKHFIRTQPSTSVVTSWVTNLGATPTVAHLYGASLQDGNLQHVYVHVHSLHPGNRSVVSIFIVSMDLKVGHGGVFTGFRHHIAAVAHEVVFETVKGGVVWVSTCSTGACMKDGGGRNVLLPAWVTNIFYYVHDDGGPR